MFLRSASGRSSGRLPCVFSTLVDSPVNALSLTCREKLSRILPSATTMSPASSSTRSPGTSSLEGISFFFPSRMTFAHGADRFFRLSSDFSAFWCCTVPKTAFITRTTAITIVLSTFPENMEISAAISKMTMSKSANCDKKTFRSPGLFPSSSIFSPHVSRIFCTCFSDNPCSVVENTSLSCSLEYFQYFFMACPPCVVVQKKKRDFFAPE